MKHGVALYNDSLKNRVNDFPNFEACPMSTLMNLISRH